jgi:hypothetical protein
MYLYLALGAITEQMDNFTSLVRYGSSLNIL